MIGKTEILDWLTDNGYRYVGGKLFPNMNLEESQRMINELLKENENGSD